MIPNIFISSTVGDLRYLRDALRDAVMDLAYHPIMSEHAEVGYLNPITAAESCYRSIQQCQMAVLIVGRRYGDPSEEGGISVTHKEFRTARDHGIPLIGFVEAQVLAYKDVFKANPDPTTWKNFTHMDHPELTFALVDEITSSETYNGLIPFTNVAEAKKALKLQIADFVGQSLTQIISPMRTEIKDVLSEIKTLRHEMQGIRKPDQRFLQAIRFMVDDANTDYRHFIENTFGPLDSAIPLLIESSSFDDYLKKAGTTIKVIASKGDIKELTKAAQDGEFFEYASSRPYGAMLIDPQTTQREFATYACLRGNKCVLNENAKQEFDWKHGKFQLAIK